MSSASAIREAPNGTGAPDPSASSSEFDILADLRKELEQLSVANREIFEELRSDAAVDLEPIQSKAAAGFAERRPHFDPVTSATEWTERQQEYEGLLEEKSELIRNLHLRIQQLEEGAAPAPAAELDAVEIHDAAVERMKAKLEEQRRQLEEDEQALMRQMREMELSLAKDRADLARQRNELQRLQADFQRELETASRDPDLRERLMSLQRRHVESESKRSVERPVERPVEPTAPPPVAAPAQPARPKSSIIRRIFG